MKKLFTLLCTIVVFVSAINVLGSNTTGKEKSATANFSTDITLLTSGSSINYVDISTGSPVSWQWTFEGGQPATYSGKIPPPVKYNFSGQYDVVLTVLDGSGNVSIETKSDYIDVVDAPPGWSPQTSASTHLISVPASITLTGFPIAYGNFLGVFYLDENNQEKCGGFTPWDGSNNRALIAFGDDATTPVKEGFADGELMRWKVYLTQYADQADAIVAYNPAMPVSDGNFHGNGMSGITSLDVSYTIPLVVQATASPAQICAGAPVQLNAVANGGTLSYNYSWSSSPAGFISNLQNPVVFPGINTTYTIVVNDGDNTATASTAVIVTIQPDANAGADATIVAGHSFDVSGSAVSGAAALQWATSGDGTFSSYSILHPKYAPGTGDIIAGQVQLCLTAQPVAPCANPDSDCMNLVIEPSVIVSAGTDQTVCANQTIVLSNASAENYSEIMWSTNGSGTFDKANLLHPEYFPSADDVSLGSVSLCITATALPPEISSVADCMTVSFQQLPEVDAGSDFLVCQGSSINVSEATATNAGNLLWITSGAGTFSNQNELNPIYYPDFFDYQAQCITLTLMVSGLDPCTTGSQDAVEVCFKLLPQADAGGDQIICAADQAELSGSFQDACGTAWTTQGDGTFDDANALQTTYTPGVADKTEGSVLLCFTAQPCDPCINAHTDCLTLTVQPQATVDLGLDALLCENEIFVSNTSTAANYSQVQWFTTNGTGIFEDETQLLTSYFPSAADYLVGCVTLGIMVSSINPCEAVAEDFVELCFQTPPAADAGANATVCEGQNFVATQATAGNFSEIQWTGGDGFFNDPTILNAVYTPAASEAGTSIELCLTASPLDPCSMVAMDCLSLFVQPTPEVFAGDDVTFCEGVIVQLNQAIASNYSQVMWMPVTGMGDFSNFFSLTTSYAPSPFDYQAGCITLALTAQPVNPCIFAVVDTLEVCFQKPAAADAGLDQTVCGTDAFQIVSSDALHFTTVNWTTAGDGTFDNPQLLHPNYYPGNADIAALSVNLTITAQGISPCATADSDALTLTVQPSPDVFAGSDVVLPAGEVYINDDATVAFADSFFWQSFGDGTFDDPNILHAQYTHGSADQANGSVRLFLAAQPISPCLVAETDSLILSVASPPMVSVPEDFVICSDASAILSESNAGNFASLLWQTIGDGTFDDSTILNAVYYPGAADASAGTVELCLIAQPLLPLFPPAMDCIEITIQKAPTAFAGNDQIICESENVELSEATANNAEAV
ncbi:MAG: hypothetical protein EOM83_14380, partial [Clostridia bacterium]|nr:hypothetical protein [Clostridia bacterium]